MSGTTDCDNDAAVGDEVALKVYAARAHFAQATRGHVPVIDVYRAVAVYLRELTQIDGLCVVTFDFSGDLQNLRVRVAHYDLDPGGRHAWLNDPVTR